MTIKLKDLKVLPPDHPIYTEDFKTYPVNPSKNKKLHLTEVRPGMSTERIKKNLLKFQSYLECWMTVAKIKELIAREENRKAFFSEYE